MNRLIACTLALLLVLLTPASANSAPTRLGGTGGSALTVDEGCPVTVTAEQLTFDVSGAGDSNGLTAHVKAVYQMENPTENPLSVQMSFYLEEHRGHMDSLVDVDSAVSSITADGQSLPFTIQEVETEDAAVDRFALTYAVEFPAWGTREVAVAYLSSSYGLREGTTYWTQEFTYLLSPARHWAEFGSLDIIIRTPEPVPYIVRSSLPLREAEERCYTAHFDGLPDGELTFTLYPRLSITLADRLHAVLTSYQFTFAFFLLILPLTLLALPALLIFLLQRRSRRQPWRSFTTGLRVHSSPQGRAVGKHRPNRSVRRASASKRARASPSRALAWAGLTTTGRAQVSFMRRSSSRPRPLRPSTRT